MKPVVDSTRQEAVTGERLVRVVVDLIRELHPQRAAVPVTLDSRLERELGLDSLGRVELLARLERTFGVTIAERDFSEAQTPRDLLRAVVAAAPAFPQPAAPMRAPPLREAPLAELPHAARTLPQALDWHAKRYPGRVHVRLFHDQADDELITYAALHEGARTVASGVQRLGLEPGSTVALMLPTGREYFEAFFGVLLAGAIPVPIYPPARASQLEDHVRRHWGILNNCAAELLITVPEAAVVARLLRANVPSLRHVATPARLRAGPMDFSPPAIGENATALLQYTSGSTGNPKGVILTHANLLANIRAMGQAINAGPGDVFVSWLPLYHDMGLIGAWLGSLYHAATLVVMSPLDFLTRPQRWLWALHRYRGTLTAAPNFAFELCLQRVRDEDIQGLDLSTVRLLFNGAEPVSPATLERFAARFAAYGLDPKALTPVYGLAECSVGLAFPPPGRGPRVDSIQRETFARTGQARPAPAQQAGVLRFPSCGLPLPGHALRIVDEAGRELPEREEGRVQFRGPSATSGYFHNPEETRRLFQGRWLESGDLGYLAEGELYLTGRSKDVIIRAGRNVYPHEMEEAVGELAGVRKGRVAVFAATAPREGTERLVVLAETREQDPQARAALRARIMALCADLAGAPPDDVVLAGPGTVLKTSSGKIRRAACRELYERKRLGSPPAAWRQTLRLILPGLFRRGRTQVRRAGMGLFCGYAWACFWLLAPPVWLAVVLLPRPAWRWRVMRGGARLLARLTATPLRVAGLEHLQAQRPRILVANHASYLDGMVLVAALPPTFGFVAKAELRRKVLPRLFLEGIGAQFVERLDWQQGAADARRLADAVRGGQSLLFFPEGTFARASGLLPFHLGAFLAAVAGPAPVLPIALRGTRAILREGSWFVRRGTITVLVGTPIEPPPGGEDAARAWAGALALRDQARQWIVQHCGEPDRGGEQPGPA